MIVQQRVTGMAGELREELQQMTGRVGELMGGDRLCCPR